MNTFRGSMAALAFLLALTALPRPARSVEADRFWGEWRYLRGDWVGVGGGQPGEASAGGFGFAAELDGRVLVRRSYAEYAATRERAAFRHEDLILLYRDRPGAGARALYADNEGHVIHYEAAADTVAGTYVFTSVPDPRLPRYRFSYRALTTDSLAFRFEIAPPGKPDSLATYVTGTARRRR